MLVVDKRERLSRHEFNDVFETGNIVESTLTYGDYAICDGDDIKFMFERKTLEDYVASMKDGRFDNIQTMVTKAREIGVQKVFLILEGPLLSDDAVIGGIKYSTIVKGVDMLTIMQNIYQMRTLNHAETIARLMYMNDKCCSTSKKAEIGTLTERKVKSDYDKLLDLLVGNLARVGKVTAAKILAAGSVCEHVENWDTMGPKLQLTAEQLKQYNAFFGGVAVSVLESNDLRHLYGCSKATEGGMSIRNVCLHRSVYTANKFKILFQHIVSQ